MQLGGQITSMNVSTLSLLVFGASMTDYFFLLRSVEVQTVTDLQDQNRRRICFATL